MANVEADSPSRVRRSKALKGLIRSYKALQGLIRSLSVSLGPPGLYEVEGESVAFSCLIVSQHLFSIVLRNDDLYLAFLSYGYRFRSHCTASGSQHMGEITIAETSAGFEVM